MTQEENALLKVALLRLAELSDPESKRMFTLPREWKLNLAQYVRVYIMPAIQLVLKSPKERDRLDREKIAMLRRDLGTWMFSEKPPELPTDLAAELVELLKDAVLQKPGWRQAASTRLAQLGVPQPPRDPLSGGHDYTSPPSHET